MNFKIDFKTKLGPVFKELLHRTDQNVKNRAQAAVVGALTVYAGFGCLSAGQSITDGMTGGRAAVAVSQKADLPLFIDNLPGVRGLVDVGIDSYSSGKNKVPLSFAAGAFGVTGTVLVTIGFIGFGIGISGGNRAPLEPAKPSRLQDWIASARRGKKTRQRHPHFAAEPV